MLKTNYNVYSDELYHHGIQGQKWGQRNGPPYPLSQGARSPEERKENKKSSYTHPEVEVKKVKKTKSGTYGGGAELARQHADVAKRAEERSKNDKKAYSDYVNRLNTLDDQKADYVLAKKAKLYSKDELKEMKNDFKQSKKDFNEAYKADKKAIKRGYKENEAKKEQARQDAYDSLSNKEKVDKFINETAHSLTKSAASFVADSLSKATNKTTNTDNFLENNYNDYYNAKKNQKIKDKFKTVTELLGTKIDEKWSVDKYYDNVDKNMKKAGVIDSNHSGVGRVW